MKENYIITGLFESGEKIRVAFETLSEARFVYGLLEAADDERSNLTLWRFEDAAIIDNRYGLNADDYRRLGL